MKKIIPFLLVSAGIGIGIVIWSYINKPTEVAVNTPTVKSRAQPSLPSVIVSPQSVKSTTEPSIEYANPSVVIDAIETAVPEKKWSDLLHLMTPNVTLIKYATSCCGSITKNEAIAELSYLNNATAPWNFSETNPIALKLESEDPEHFKDMWIGTSKDYYAVGFKWNDQFLIEKISIVNNYQLIIGN